MTAELRPLGDCPTCGRPRWADAKCRCGHGVLGHDFGTSKGVEYRRECTHTDANGRCGCQRFVEAVTEPSLSQPVGEVS